MQVPVKKARILCCLFYLGIFFTVHFAYSQNISFSPVTNYSLITASDCANVETAAYKDILITGTNSQNHAILYVAWGGPIDINQFGKIISDNAYTETTLVSNLSGWTAEAGTKFADIYNNGQMDVVALSDAPNPTSTFLRTKWRKH